jgi:hypothetical protein
MVHAQTHNRTHNTRQESVCVVSSVVSIMRFWPALPLPDTTPMPRTSRRINAL